MKVGDIYIHTNVNERLRIRTVGAGVCTADFIDRPKVLDPRSREMAYEYCICNVKYLVPEVEPTPENQLTLFK